MKEEIETNTSDLELLRYPIGKFKKHLSITKEMLQDYILEIDSFPHKIAEAIHGLSEDQIEIPYRPGGWTIRQVVHHCADSHLNSYMRFKLALTEDTPIIKPYFEDRWATLADSMKSPLNDSLRILEGLHKRWVLLLRALSETDLEKGFIHPEHGKKLILKDVIALYAWHCNHHLAHIIQLKIRSNW